MKITNNTSKLIPLVIISILLTACGVNIDNNRPTNVQYIENTDSTWLNHLSKLKEITQYGASGQLGYISPKEKFSTHFDWQYNTPQSYTLFLSSTISNSTLLLSFQENKLTISDNRGQHRSEKDAKLLLREIIGMDIPLKQLTVWLKGQPDTEKNYHVGINHLLANLAYTTQDATWTVDYLNYHTKLAIPMPRDILLKNKNQTLKIRIETWKF